ncbi:FeS cluster assembly scaffold IscU [gamma proteobacterium HTCC5015]|nr:FeS cluster assembly scaffold IscU [gamma proteobacterium HTCC5015]
MAHFDQPRNVGELDDTQEGVGSACAGDAHRGEHQLRIQLYVGDSDCIEKTAFKAYGSGAVIASCSFATEWAKGKTLAQLSDLDAVALCEALQLEDSERGLAVQVCQALNRAGDDIEQKQNAD